jgi:drug/metabolite transporter (DMT)-like permease
MLGVAILYSFTSVGGKGAMQYMPPEQFGPFYFCILGIFTLLLLGSHRPATIQAIWRRPGATLVIGLLMGVMVMTHFLALEQIETAYMIAAKRTSLLFGILYGALLFKEQGLGLHLFAGGLMVAGVILISL